MESIQYYRPDHRQLDGNMILVSGQCPQVKAFCLAQQLRQALRMRSKAVVIDFARTGDFTGILDRCGYSSQHAFVTDRDNYAQLELPLRKAIVRLKTFAKRSGYGQETCTIMTTYLNFLMGLEMYDGRSATIRQLLKKYSSQDKLEKFLCVLLKMKKITTEEAEEAIQTYLEYVQGGITADAILAELDLFLKPCPENVSFFSLMNLKPGEAAVLYADKDNSTDTNDIISRIWTSDLISMSDEPLMIVINTGHHSQINRMYELVETVSHNPNVNLFFSSNDLFTDNSIENAKAFAKIFRYSLWGRHAGDSAKVISSLFSEQWLTQFNQADAHNQRIMGESLIDKLLGTDHTTTVSTTLVREGIVPAYSITKLADQDYILFDTATNEVQVRSVFV